MRKLVLSFGILFLAAFFAVAQDAEIPVTGWIHLPESIDGDDDLEIAAIIQEDLISYLESRLFTISVGTEVPAEPHNHTEDLTIQVLYTLEGRNVNFMVKVYDTQGPRFIAGALGSGRNTITIHEDLLEGFLVMDDALERERQFIAARKAGNLPDSGLGFARLTFTSPQDGVAVELLGAGPLGVLAGNVLESPVTPLALGQDIEVEYSLDGFYPETQRVTVSTGTESIQIPRLYPKTTWTALANYHFFQLFGFGAGIRYYPVEDRIFFELDDYFFIQTDDYPGAKPIYHNDTTVLAGAYPFSGPQNSFRLGVYTGVGANQTMLPGLSQALRLDPYLVLVGLAPEWNLRRITLGLRWELRYAFGIPGLDNVAPPLLPQAPYYAESPSSLYLGVKL